MAGAGLASIAFPSTVWPLDGFASQTDALFVRVLVVASSSRLAWVVVDQTALQPELLATVQAEVARIAGLAPPNVVISVSHTFSAPHLREPLPADEDEVRMRSAVDALLSAVAAATQAAVGSLRPATVGVAAGASDISVNRDVETHSGWGLGIDPSGFTDSTLTCARIDDIDGAAIAILLNYAV